MSRKQVLRVVPMLFLLSPVGAACDRQRPLAEAQITPQTGIVSEGQSREPEDQIKLARQYFEADTKCRGLLKQEKWKEAEAACLAETRLAERFADQRELEKMGAYENVGVSLAGQKRYAEAITYYTRALEISRPRLTDANAEVGQLYGRIALSYHAMRDLDKAREFYRKAAQTYQIAYAGINEEEVVEEGLKIKRGYLKILKSILEFHLIAAEQAGAAAEVEEIKQQLAALPK
ncbi:MAG: tetratricopeptide repeat protein [Acidobacteria bacterium]|nr:tetratricopeptide repeat protein [Acidobacteriota bacterium]